MESQIKTEEDAFNYTGRDIKNLPIVDHLPEEDRAHEIADYKWKVIIAALNKEANEGKKYTHNWFDRTIKKHFPWLWVEASEEQPAGFGFSYTGTLYDGSHAIVGSRLSFKEERCVLYALKQFPEIAKQVYLDPQTTASPALCG